MFDDQFTAVGPPNPNSGLPDSGFSTGSNREGDPVPFQFGVFAHAIRFGVVGHNTEGVAGVYGHGDFGVLGTAFGDDSIGVLGASVTDINQLMNPQDAPPNEDELQFGRGEGVVGRSGDGTGVRGQSDTGTGVVGRSGTGRGVLGQSGTGTGVHGHSASGIGVYGHSDRATGVWGDSTSQNGVYGHSEQAIGVHGESNTGGGVYGHSVSGIGVAGSSENRPGGEFESTTRGQIRLVTRSVEFGTGDSGEYPKLPSSGESGEMIAVVQKVPPPTQLVDQECSLWLCVSSSTPATPALWAPVQLGSAISGEG